MVAAPATTDGAARVTAQTTAGERVRLTDGRWLGYAQFGDPRGKPVFLFHGIPGSRLYRPPDDDLATSLGVRLITVDRPGFGLSSFQPGRRLLDWPSDVAALADELGIDRFAVAGMSAGGPYAAACALRLPERVNKVGLISSACPYRAPGVTRGMALSTRLSFWWAGSPAVPSWALYPAVSMVALAACGDRATFWHTIGLSLPAADQAVLRLPGVKEIFLASLPEAYRQGPSGHVHDAMLVARPWGFSVASLRTPVFLWHGTEDTLAPVGMGRYLAGAIPGCQATWLSGEGHLVMFRPEHWRAMLGALSCPD